MHAKHFETVSDECCHYNLQLNFTLILIYLSSCDCQLLFFNGNSGVSFKLIEFLKLSYSEHLVSMDSTVILKFNLR